MLTALLPHPSRRRTRAPRLRPFSPPVVHKSWPREYAADNALPTEVPTPSSVSEAAPSVAKAAPEPEATSEPRTPEASNPAPEAATSEPETAPEPEAASEPRTPNAAEPASEAASSEPETASEPEAPSSPAFPAQTPYAPSPAPASSPAVPAPSSPAAAHSPAAQPIHLWRCTRWQPLAVNPHLIHRL